MKFFGFGGRRAQVVQESIDHVYTGSGYRIRDADLRKIHRAAVKGDAAEVERCLARRSGDLNARDKRHRTALHLACARGHVAVVTLLVDRKCQIDIRDKLNRTPLIQAVHSQEETCASILLKHGANPNLKDIYGNTALHYAVYNDSTSLAEKLLSHDANIEALDKDRNTPLLFAIICKREKMVQFLVKNQANVHAANRLRRSALILAVHHGLPDIVNLLLQQNVSIFFRDMHGRDVGDYAISCGSKRIQNQITEHKKKILEKDNPDAGSSDESLVSIFQDLYVDSHTKPEDEGLTVTTKQCVPEKVSEPLPGPSDDKGNSVVNGKKGPPAKQLSGKPTTEREDPAVKEVVQKKNEQTSRAGQDFLVDSEEEQESLEISEKKEPEVEEGKNTNKSEEIQLSENTWDSTSSDATVELTQQTKIRKTSPQQFPKDVKEEHDRCTLKQENEEKSNVNMLYKNLTEGLERKWEQYEKEVKQQLKLTVRSLEMEPKTLRNIPNQDFHNHEEMKDLMHENGILKRDIAMLREEICTLKNDSLEKENKYFKDFEIIEEINTGFENRNKLSEEMITKIVSQCLQQLNDLRAENTRLNSELGKEREDEERLEAEIESYQSRLAAAIREHNQRVKTERDLKLSLQRTQDISLQRNTNSELKDKYEFLKEKLSKTQIKFNTLKDKVCKTSDTLREKTLALETAQNDLSQTQQQIKEMKEMYQNADAKVSKSTGEWNYVEERLCELQRKNLWLKQQLDDAYQKGDNEERVINIQGGFIESGKKGLLLEEKNKKLMNECNHLKERLFQHEKEKAEVSIKEDKYFQTFGKNI
ncbi:ankyrin repeat domain-containing protein 20A1 [Saimiri boliviensis]|uniref:Ankyrin repeat domain 20 family member A1 n=1 Tax=Saimiri boliviensis boliviensis TaxID=39432 RepID=A0A2K6U1Z7_SAIBB|nr:ankyrin repeat domain-containing protein 20A1 [Saimiri boliviensis boliviensis]